MNDADVVSASADTGVGQSGAALTGADAKSKPLAKVSLTSFVVYRVNGRQGDPEAQVDVLYGGEAARFTPEGKLQLLATSVPFHSEGFKAFAPKPGHALLALYGRRDALEELKFWRDKARSIKADFAYVTYEAEVGRIADTLIDRKRMREGHDARFLNLRRTMSSLQTEIFERFAGYVASEGTNTTMTSIAHIASRPDLFDRLFVDDKDFSHLSVFVTPIADDLDSPGKMRQVAYVRPGAILSNVVQGSDHVDVLMPAWLTDVKAAKKERAKH